MKDVNLLKRLTIQEKIGWLLLKKKKKAFIIILTLFLTYFLISFIQYVVASSEIQSAENDIAKAETRLDRVHQAINIVSDRLEKNKHLYKDYDAYKSKLGEEEDLYNNLLVELDDIKTDLEDKKTKKVLEQFESDDDNDLFPDKITPIDKSIISIYSDITAVQEIDQYLISEYPSFEAYKKSLDESLKSRYDNLNIIQAKGKTAAVKDKANSYFSRISNDKNSFIISLKGISPYTSDQQGEFSLKELKEIQKKYRTVEVLLNNADSSINAFDGYWNELHQQYYTVVKKQYSQKSTDYVTEPNPDYDEWTETETYEDTETYTEKEYVGSRVVGDEQEDIYENVTKERPVTRTRTVTKNNGEPKTISVPYDVYTFYYTIEKHSPTGVLITNEEVGENHEKYDADIRNWDYDDAESVGYIEWKQLWNDNSSILRGKNLSPKME